MRLRVCNFTSYAILLFEYTTIMLIMALHWPALVESMDRVSCWPWTNRPYVVCIAVCLHEFEVVILLLDAVLGRNLTLIMCCPNTLHWRWRLCVDLRLLNVWNGFRVGHGWTARTFVSLCMYLNEPEVVIDVWDNMHDCSRTLTLIICVLSKQCATIMAIPTLHWSPLVECMERVSCWSWTNSSYVCSYCCVCDWPYSKLLLVFNTVVWERL